MRSFSEWEHSIFLVETVADIMLLFTAAEGWEEKVIRAKRLGGGQKKWGGMGKVVFSPFSNPLPPSSTLTQNKIWLVDKNDRELKWWH